MSEAEAQPEVAARQTSVSAATPALDVEAPRVEPSSTAKEAEATPSAAAQTSEEIKAAEHASENPEPATSAAPAKAADANAGIAASAGSEKPAEAASEPQKVEDTTLSPVGQLQAKLPSIIKDAGLDGPTATIWGVALDPSSSSDAQEAVLKKFVDAREGDIDAAAAQLTSTLKWRKEFKPEEAAKESFPEETFGKLGIILPGRTKDGQPVTLNLYGEVKDNQIVFGDLDRFLRWRVGLMEKGIALLQFDGSGPSTMVQVHDYAGVSMFSRDAASKRAASEASKLFSDHYPELLSRKFFVNVPGWAAFIFKIFSNFLSARTLSKFTVLGQNKNELHSAFAEIMDDDVIPERYGGRGKEV